MNLLVLNIRVDADHPTQSVTTRWLQSLSRRFEKIFVITVHQGRLSLPGNISVHPLSSCGIDNKISRTIRLYFFLAYILFKERPIHGVFVHQAVVLGAMVGLFIRLLRIPILLWYCHRDVNLWLRLCHLWATGAISSSKDSFQLGSRKLAITGHGIDTEAFKPEGGFLKKRSGLIIGYVGRYSPIKRLEVLFEALEILVSRGFADVSVDLYGLCQNLLEERYLRQLLSIVDERGLQPFVRFHDAVNNWKVPSLLPGFDLFVSQQETGGTDKAILEAMSCALPVVMATTSFNAYLPQEIVNKLVFSSGSAREMGEKIEGIVKLKKEERRALGNALRDLVETHHSLNTLSLRIYRIMAAMSRESDWKWIAMLKTNYERRR